MEIDAFGFELSPHARHRRVIEAMVGATETDLDAECLKEGLILGAGELRASIRMMQQVTVLDSIRCELQPSDPRRVRYACTRQAFEGTQYNQTLIVDGPAGSPILFLVESPRP
jgi:hypothetical protein